MKIFSAVILVICSGYALSARPPRRHALLVGVSEYARRGVDPDAVWWDTNAANDVTALNRILQTKFNFKPNEIRILCTRRETTKRYILNALRDLTNAVEPGDIVYLHYSGHGAQVLDDDADEIDGLDETLVPSDYASRDDGSKNIRDDEIDKFLIALRVKKPASVTFTFDSCFSGTITRAGRQTERGAKYRGETPTPRKTKTLEDDANEIVRAGTLGKNFVVITAARSDEAAKETDDDAHQRIGALTFALVKAFGEASGQTTYRDVFQRVQYFVGARNRQQNPQIEGAIDTRLLQGTANPAEPYINVGIDRENGLILQAGSLQGMTKGSKFALYPNGTKTRADGTKIADAEIIEIGATTARLTVVEKTKNQIKAETWQTARAFETLHNYADEGLKVAAGKITRPNRIIDDLKENQLVKFTEGDDWAVRIRWAEDKARGDETSIASADKILLERADGSRLGEIEDNREASLNIRRALEREARFRTIQNLENSSPDLKIELRVVPVEVELDSSGAVVKVTGDKKIKPFRNAMAQIAEGEYVVLEIRNTGYLDAYVTILDLTADGNIGALFPHPRATADNKFAADGEWRRIPLPFVFRVTAPFGAEIFKALATREPADFSPLLDAQIARSDADVARVGHSPLARILRAATLARRSDVNSASPPDWATAAVRFEVIPRK